MKILKGKNQTECGQAALYALAAGFSKVHIDIGTGSGRYVLRQSMCAPDTFTIGIASFLPYAFFTLSVM